MSDDIVFDPDSENSFSAPDRNWTRWLPDPIQETVPVSTADPKESARDTGLRLKHTLARLRTQAQENGYNDGYAEGHAKGLEEGLANGHRQGHEKGYQEGYEAGHNEGREHAEQAAAQLSTLAQNCSGALANIEADMGQALVTLAVRIAEQVLHRTLNTEPESLLALIDDILAMDTGKSTILRLYVHPADLELVQDYLHDNPDTQTWRVYPDDSITRGGCKARTSLGDIDATLETRWKRVVSAIGGAP